MADCGDVGVGGDCLTRLTIIVTSWWTVVATFGLTGDLGYCIAQTSVGQPSVDRIGPV